MIVLNADPSAGTGLAFKNYHYAILPLAFYENITDAKDVYTDSGYTILIADKLFVPANLPIKKLLKKVAIRGISSNLYYLDEYVIATFYL